MPRSDFEFSLKKCFKKIKLQFQSTRKPWEFPKKFSALTSKLLWWKFKSVWNQLDGQSPEPLILNINYQNIYMTSINYHQWKRLLCKLFMKLNQLRTFHWVKWRKIIWTLYMLMWVNVMKRQFLNSQFNQLFWYFRKEGKTVCFIKIFLRALLKLLSIGK